MSHIFEEANHQILIRHDRKSLWKAPESVGNGEFFLPEMSEITPNLRFEATAKYEVGSKLGTPKLTGA